MSSRDFRIIPAVFLIAIYFLIYLAFDGLNFQLKDDENHFWPNSQIFSHTWIPSLDSLSHYNELNTPLPFVVFGWLHKFTNNGLLGMVCISHPIDCLMR
jgi:peptidoglycan/LPS O-acetylase OafA/YrhL